MKIKSKKLQSDIPKIGKTYNCFDDGKINIHRIYSVKIVNITSYDKLSEQDKEIIKNIIKHYPALYADKTDYVIKGISDETKNKNDNICIFIRTRDNGWFSIGNWWGSGRLDITGELIKSL